MRVLPPPSSEHFPNISPTFSEHFWRNHQPGEGLGRGAPPIPNISLTFPEHFRSHKTGRRGEGSPPPCSEPFPNISEGGGTTAPGEGGGGGPNSSEHFPTISRTLFRRPEPFDAI